MQVLAQLSCPQSATGSTTPSGGTDISAEVATAINQLSANQTAIMSQMAAATAQMAALAVVPPPAQNTRAYAPRKQFYVPPIQQVAVQMQQPFSAAGAYPAGRGGQRGGRGCNQGGRQAADCGVSTDNDDNDNPTWGRNRDNPAVAGRQEHVPKKPRT